MWASLLVSKDQAAAATQEFQVRTEGESGCKLMALHVQWGVNSIQRSSPNTVWKEASGVNS
jgi:hypothetical protein